LVGVPISLGAISAVEARVADAVKPAVDEAWTRVEGASVKHNPWLPSDARMALELVDEHRLAASCTCTTELADDAADVVRLGLGLERVAQLLEQLSRAGMPRHLEIRRRAC
jgi:hypothetical protein